MFETPAWDTLANYQSQDLLRQRFKEIHGRTANSGQLQGIVAAINQGKSYFKSVRIAESNIKPLLLYYGVLALSRGTILLLNPHAREATLKPGHGLSETSWSTALSSGIDASGIIVKIEQRGTFKEFVSATNNLTLLRYYVSPRIGGAWRHHQINGATSIDLKNLLSRFPDLQQQLKRWIASRDLLKVNICRSDKQEDHLVFNVDPYDAGGLGKSPTFVREFFPNMPEDAIQSHTHGIAVTGSQPNKDWPPV